jgi:acetyl-CoA C-acetyltransferase
VEDVVIASGVRTAIGRFQGSLADVPASDLGATVLKEAASRAGISADAVDGVIMGIVGPVAEDAYLSRHSSVKAGLGHSVPAMNVNRICGSGLEAITRPHATSRVATATSSWRVARRT